MARKKAQRKQETALVPYRPPDMSVLLERAQTCDSASAVKTYLDAGGSPVAFASAGGRTGGMLQFPLLYNIILTIVDLLTPGAIHLFKY
jgi:hypothetical protein